MHLKEKLVYMLLRSIHMKEENYKCKICSKAFLRRSDLTIHLSNFHQSLLKVKCDFCDIIVSNKKQLTKHVKDMHERTQSKEKCDLCYKS